MTNNFGLPVKHILEIKTILQNEPSVEQGIIFSSRAMGNYKPGSDVDLAVFGENLADETIDKISLHLNEETTMPYHFDILNGHKVNGELLKHIEGKGKIIFNKNK